MSEQAAHLAAVEVDVPTAEGMTELGLRLASVLRPGDLLVLTGDLGAGKTTLTRGIGSGLGVRGAVTSPTFVIAREHPSTSGGPALVHVDAYRIAGWEEIEDLDLESSLDEAVTVVEWGGGLVEGLASDRLEVRLVRPTGVRDDGSGEGEEPRRVVLQPVGPRWAGVRLPGEITSTGDQDPPDAG